MSLNKVKINTNQVAEFPEISYIDNPEFAFIKTDNEDRVLYGVKTDGEFFFSAGCPQQVRDYINEKISSLSLDEYEDIVAFLSDYLGSDTTLKVMIDGINAQIATKVDKVEGKSLIDAEYADGVSQIENPEFAEVHTDTDDKILYGVKWNGDFYFGVGIPSQIQEELDNKPDFADLDDLVENKVDKEEGKSLIDEGVSESQSIIEDSEGRSEITTDSEGKIISYRINDGTKVESCLRIENLELTEDVSNKIKSEASKLCQIKKFSLPDYGSVDILSETFYLTKNSGYSDKNGVYPIQVYPNTQENARLKRVCVVFYVKSTLTDNGDGTYSVNSSSVPLVFYPAKEVTESNGSYYVKKITKVNGIIYLTDTLDKTTSEGQTIYSVNPHSVAINEQVEIAEQQTFSNAIEVIQIVDTPNYLAWPVSKTPEHYCTATIDFGHYLNGTFSVGVKYQGSSTILNRKRNFRFTFYKNSTFANKDKIKIGEMVRLSGYNLKAFYGDRSKVKELIMNRIFMAIWEKRDVYDQYPWYIDNTPYCGATGMIKSFPIRLSIGGEFYGLMIFGLKKDEKNYMLDGTDESGIFVCANGGNGVWVEADHTWYDEEMLDEMSQSTADALDEFTKFFSGRLTDGEGNPIPCDRETMPERMSVLDWIDYFICLQVFVMADNTCRNMVLYTKSDKKKFYPFFYDLDLSMRFDDNDTVITMDMLNPPVEVVKDMSVWRNFYDNYKDEIINRYSELRHSILSEKYISAVYKDSVKGVPSDDNILESQIWGLNDIYYFEKIMNDLFTRMKWLDETFFKI